MKKVEFFPKNLLTTAFSVVVEDGEHGEIPDPAFPIENAYDGDWDTYFKVNPGYSAYVTATWDSPITIKKIILRNFTPDADYYFEYYSGGTWIFIGTSYNGDGGVLEIDCEITTTKLKVIGEPYSGTQYFGEIIVLKNSVKFEGLKLSGIDIDPIENGGNDRSIDGDLISWAEWEKLKFSISLEKLIQSEIDNIKEMYDDMNDGNEYWLEIEDYTAYSEILIPVKITVMPKFNYDNSSDLYKTKLIVEET